MEKYETLGRRFIALIIDSIVLGIINLIFSSSAVFFDDALLFVVSGLVSLLNVLYFILLHAYDGQTLGKKAMSVKVVDDSSEAPINFGQAVIRSLPQLIPALFAVTLIRQEFEMDAVTQVIGVLISGAAGIFHIADIVVCLINEKRRALHDFIAGTIVVRTDV